MEPNQETPADAFRRVIRETIDREALECTAEGTPLQTTCLSYLLSEQAWLDKLLRARHVKQPGIVYGFYESPQDELQAYAIEKPNETPGFIAVSTYFMVSIGFYFRAALAHRNVLGDIGDPMQELPTAETAPGPHAFARPQDPERLLIAKLLTMMAMRFLTAHEMMHILNGHIRHKTGSQGQSTIAEARQSLSSNDALFSQTLEMDADSGAVVDCMPSVIFAECDPEEPARIGCHPVYRKPEEALRLWLFATYGLFRIMEDDARPIPIAESSHPSPMLRIQMIMGTLFEFLKREKLNRLKDLLPDLIGRTIVEGESAYAAVSNRTLILKPLQLALSESAQQQKRAIIMEWRRVRPAIEPFARGGGKLAPLPEDT